MFILEFLPDNIIIAIVGGCIAIGIVGLIIDYAIYRVSFLLPYRIIIKLISTLILLVGVYFTGAFATEMEWKSRVAEVQKQVDIAEAKSQEVNTVIQEKVVQKIKVIEKKVIVNHNVIQKEKEVINAECKIPDIAFKIYNISAMGGSYE